jgi:adenine-specific DNA methylase
MSTDHCPRLIEVALPIREISAESVRDKNIHHAHISHLHIWWARRPLAASRAVVFASLVPDPDDPRCPADFRAAVQRHLKTHLPAELKYYRRGRQVHRDDDPYRPYDGMPDTPRNRLLMFIARWSPESVAFGAGSRKDPPKPKELLDDRSLVKWETSDPENPQGREVLRIARELVKVAHGGRIPTVLDPFAGGGAIPLEAGRLDCQAIANDYNPVAHLVLRATCDYAQTYGVPGLRTVTTEELGRTVERETKVPNVLVHDLRFWAEWILERARERIGHLYRPGADGRPILAYLWARTVPCSNPSCRGEIPLLRSLKLCTRGRKIALTMDVDRDAKTIRFGIAHGKAIKTTEGTKRQRGPAICPFCDQPTSEAELRRAGVEGRMGERLIAVVLETGGRKDYRVADDKDLRTFEEALGIDVDVPGEYIVPEINGPNASPNSGSHRSINLELYGFTRWGQLFNHRQLVVMNELVRCLHEAWEAMQESVNGEEYQKALATYLALWIDRVAAFGNTMCRWAAGSEIVKTPFSGQSIPMMWDFPEVNPFADSSGTASKQLEYMLKVILHEQRHDATFSTPRLVLGSATEMNVVESASCEVVVTDPPYGNSIAYADLSDFFYVWLKRSLGELLPGVFPTPQTPKDEEATSHKHRHEGSQKRANSFYRRLLTDAFKESKRAAKDPELVTVMFAHQSTDAWTALLSALFDSGLCPDATWPIATEMPKTALALGTASLETSVTVVCRPRAAAGAESFKAVKKEIKKAVEEAVHRFWSYGFRGADLIVASYGPAVGVFGKYDRVERADGTPVKVPELLDFARQAARDAIAGEFRGDTLSTLYYVWANLYGAAEQSWDDARLVVQIGGDAESAMDVARRQGIFVVTGSKCRLALLADRADRRGLGADPNPPLIDALHRAMLLWKSEQRQALVEYLTERGLLDEARFWKLAQALFEVLPRDREDWKLVSALLGERDTLRTEAKRAAAAGPQAELDFGKTEASPE